MSVVRYILIHDAEEIPSRPYIERLPGGTEIVKASDYDALAAELAAVKADRDTWRDEAVWAANEFMKERECFFQVSYMGRWEAELAQDPDYQRAKGIVERAK